MADNFWFTGAQVLDHNGEPWRKSLGAEAGITVPHFMTFQSVYGSTYKTYFHGRHDAAIRHDPEYAANMTLDPHLMRLVRERKDGTSSLKFQLETDDDTDPRLKVVKQNVWHTIQQTRRISHLVRGLLDAAWVGRSGIQKVYETRVFMLPDPNNPAQNVPTKCPVVVNHQPEDGDKFGFQFDETPYVLVNAGFINQVPNMEVITTNMGRGALLKGEVRDRFIIHRHENVDAPFQHGDRAGSIFGLGIRNAVYWLAWLKNELMSSILEYTERQGLGLKVWYYDGNNPTSKQEVEYAASHQTNRTNILVPRYRDVGGRGGVSEGVEVVDTSTAGANLLLQIYQEYKDEIALYIIGQTLSSGTEGSGLGGTGVAGLHSETKYNIIKYDAENLAETLTHDWVRKVLAWQHPEFAWAPLRWKFHLPPANPEERLRQARMIYDMGGKLSYSEVMECSGFTIPQDDEETLSMAQTQQTMPQQPAPTDGDGDGVAGEGDEDMAWLQNEMSNELEGAVA